MENSFADLMRVLIEHGKKYKPLLTDKLRMFDEKVEAAKETKTSGGATSEARQALQVLRNPLLNSTHYLGAQRAAAVLVKTTGKDFSKSLEVTLQDYMTHELALLEYSLHSGTKGSEYTSREQSPLEDRPDLIRFVNELEPSGVAPHMLGRLYAWMYPFIARLIVDAMDRGFERPDNAWPLLKQAGFLDAYYGELSEDEARLLDGAALVRDDPEASAQWEEFCQRFPDLDLTASFKANAQRLILKSGELSDGEARAMSDARRQGRAAQTETLGKLLGLPADELTKVDHLVRTIENPDWRTPGHEEDFNRRLIVNFLLLHIEEGDRQGEHPADWLTSLVPKLLNEDGFIARHVSSEAAFWSLYFLALELSTFRQKEETKFLRQRATADEATREALKGFYQQNDMPHHTDRDGIPWLGEAQQPDEYGDDHDEDQVEPGWARPPPEHGAGWQGAAGNHVVDAEYTPAAEDNPPDHLKYRPAYAIDELKPDFCSSTVNNTFEEYE